MGCSASVVAAVSDPSRHTPRDPSLPGADGSPATTVAPAIPAPQIATTESQPAEGASSFVGIIDFRSAFAEPPLAMGHAINPHTTLDDKLAQPAGSTANDLERHRSEADTCSDDGGHLFASASNPASSFSHASRFEPLPPPPLLSPSTFIRPSLLRTASTPPLTAATRNTSSLLSLTSPSAPSPKLPPHSGDLTLSNRPDAKPPDSLLASHRQTATRSSSHDTRNESTAAIHSTLLLSDDQHRSSGPRSGHGAQTLETRGTDTSTKGTEVKSAASLRPVASFLTANDAFGPRHASCRSGGSPRSAKSTPAGSATSPAPGSLLPMAVTPSILHDAGDAPSSGVKLVSPIPLHLLGSMLATGGSGGGGGSSGGGGSGGDSGQLLQSQSPSKPSAPMSTHHRFFVSSIRGALGPTAARPDPRAPMSPKPDVHPVHGSHLPHSHQHHDGSSFVASPTSISSSMRTASMASMGRSGASNPTTPMGRLMQSQTDIRFSPPWSQSIHRGVVPSPPIGYGVRFAAVPMMASPAVVSPATCPEDAAPAPVIVSLRGPHHHQFADDGGHRIHADARGETFHARPDVQGSHLLAVALPAENPDACASFPEPPRSVVLSTMSSGDRHELVRTTDERDDCATQGPHEIKKQEMVTSALDPSSSPPTSQSSPSLGSPSTPRWPSLYSKYRAFADPDAFVPDPNPRDGSRDSQSHEPRADSNSDANCDDDDDTTDSRHSSGTGVPGPPKSATDGSEHHRAVGTGGGHHLAPLPGSAERPGSVRVHRDHQREDAGWTVPDGYEPIRPPATRAVRTVRVDREALLASSRLGCSGNPGCDHVVSHLDTHLHPVGQPAHDDEAQGQSISQGHDRDRSPVSSPDGSMRAAPRMDPQSPCVAATANSGGFLVFCPSPPQEPPTQCPHHPR